MAAKADRTELFETMSIPKAVATLSVPMVLSSLVMVLYNLADTYFVGMLNDPIQNAAVTLAYPVLLAFNAVNNLFGVGSSSMMSRSLGAGDHEKVRQASTFGVYGAIFTGLLFSFCVFTFNTPLLKLLGTEEITLAPTREYLFWTTVMGAAPAILNVVIAQLVRAEGSALHASIGTMSGCILNIILDPFFILPFGLNMGAAGAGLATFISNCFACLYFFVLIIKRKNNTYVCLDIRRFTLKPDVVVPIVTVGIPAAIQNLLNVTGTTILNNFTSSYGANAVAAMGIAQKVTMIPTQMVLGVSQGVMPLVGYNYASGNVKRMKDALYFTTGIAMVLILGVTAGLWIWAPDLIKVFLDNPDIVRMGSTFLHGLALSLPFTTIDFTGIGVFQAVGLGKHALFFAILRKIILEIPCLFILNKLFPLTGLASARTVAEAGVSVAAVITLSGIFRKLKQKQTN